MSYIGIVTATSGALLLGGVSNTAPLGSKWRETQETGLR